MNLTELSQTVMAIVQRAVDDHTAYQIKVEADNRSTVDQAKQTDPYLQVSIVPMLGQQAELGQNPNIKQTGQILLATVVKAGAGTADAKALLDFVLPYFSVEAAGPLQFHAAYPVQGKLAQGWWYQPAIVPYFYFSRPH